MGSNSLLMKILVAVVAITLMGGILLVANTLVGNPISSKVASKAMQEYVDQNYPTLDLALGKTSYNFTSGYYMAFARSKTSADTWFSIYYRDGQVQQDNYETYVLGMFNTLQRLGEEYSAVAKRIIADELGYQNNSTTVMYDKAEYGISNPNLYLDMIFDKSLPIAAEVSIHLELADDSLEGIAEILTAAHGAFMDNGCYFQKYSLYADNEDLMVMVTEVTPQDIEGGNLLELLKSAEKSNSASGIGVFIKDGK